MVKNQAARKWERWPSQVLSGRTLGILGVGQIAEALATKARVFGMHVVGISSTLRAVEGFDRMYARNQLRDAVREIDYLVLLTPYSSETHHLVDKDILARMKPGAFLINVARGGVINETDLIHALRTGVIRGAALDVFEKEPLGTDSELWSLSNVIISPHLAGLNTSYPESILPLLERNVARFLAGQLDAMENIITRH
jgi:phosphoglycerate dehydrogenase-like enzyme